MIPETFPAFQTSPSFAPVRKTFWQHEVAQSDLPFYTKGFLGLLSIEWMDANGGSCFPSQEQIMEKMGISRPTLTHCIRQAVDGGFLEVHHYGRGIHNRRYNYQARLPDDWDGKVSFASPPEDGKAAFASLTMSNVNHAQERAEPEPAAPKPADPPPLSPVVLRTCKTPPPDTVPEEWLTLGAELRPDLDACVIETSADRFLNLRRAQGVMLTHWTPAWRNWIKGEYGPKPVTPATSAHSKPYAIQQPSPYAGWENGKPAPIGAPTTPESDLAAFERDMRSYGAEKQADGTWRRPAPLIERPVVTPEPRPTVSVMPPLSGNSRLREKAARIAALMDSGLSLEEVRALEAQREV